jgi:twitching motility protein PilT
MDIRIQQLLSLAVANKASDLHIFVRELPRLRVNGELTVVGSFTLEEPAKMEEMILTLMLPEQQERFKRDKELDYSVKTDEARFRVNTYYQKGEVATALRVVPSKIPNFVDLNLPETFRAFSELKQGFILLTGPTGQGKSTTVASILNEINLNRSSHIITIEDPVEYLLTPEKSLVSQREVGYDTPSFPSALRTCLRQDPNVVFVGEMRDLDTIQSALTIAETGHLVFSTLHTNSAAQTIDRIVDVFPEGTQEQIKIQLSSVITAVISQRLVPGINGGRVPAFEIMMATPAIKNAIREGKSFMIDNIIQTSADLGMVGMETSLANLVHKEIVAEDVAYEYALRPVEFQNKLRSYKSL